MKEIGISVYPNISKKSKIIEYIEKSASMGFSRIFTSLLYIEGDAFNTFKEIIDYANKKNMNTVIDVSPNVFKELKIDLSDLRNCSNLDYFKKLGVWAIRLDNAFTGIEESLMTFNDSDIKIEINMSEIIGRVDTIMSYKPNKRNLLGCHNFYPHEYTGLSREFFRRGTKEFVENGIPTAAFVSSNIAKEGVRGIEKDKCPIPTLEEHRNLNIALQTKDLFKEGMDAVLISNCFPSDEELKAVASVNRDMIELKADLNPIINNIEREIILDNLHFYRGDITPYRIRSTMTRAYYKDKKFPVHSAKDIKRGDILIDSSDYLGYAGELQIALKDTKNNGLVNVVGKVINEELDFLDGIEAWEKFKIIENK